MRLGSSTTAPSSSAGGCLPQAVWRPPALPPAAAAVAAPGLPCCAAASTGSTGRTAMPCSSSSRSRSWTDRSDFPGPGRPGRRGGSSWQRQLGQHSTRPACAAASSSSGSSSASQLISSSASSSQAAGSSCVVTPTGWHPLDLPSIWKGTEEQAVFKQATPYPLSPTWKVILLSDGSVTRHLQLMTNRRVQVECLEMRNIGHQREGLPPQTEHIPGPLVQRQVLLHIPGAPQPSSQQAFVYATSWWNADTVDRYLRDRSQPIWVSLSEGRTELYREILQLELGHCPYLEQRFQAQGPFWGRQYLFWHDGKPLTLIYEVFSTALEEFLGSSLAAGKPEAP